MTVLRSFACLLSAVVVLAGCQTGPPTRAQTVADADLTACRARADEIYNKQNRAEVYRSDVFANDTKDAPYATNGLADVPSNGLSGLYEHDNLVSNCVNSRNGGGSAGGSSGPAPSTATPLSTQ